MIVTHAHLLYGLYLLQQGTQQSFGSFVRFWLLPACSLEYDAGGL
jgi:hypothetical protein